MEVYSNDFGMYTFKSINDCAKWFASPASDVEEDTSGGMQVVDKEQMGGHCEEETDEKVVDLGSRPTNHVQHQLSIIKPSRRSLRNNSEGGRRRGGRVRGCAVQNYIIMKEENSPVPEPSPKPFGSLSPAEQDKLLKQQLGRRIRESQVSRIRGMSISEVNQLVDRDVDPPMDESRANRIRLLNLKLGVSEEMVESGMKTPGEKHLEMIEQSEALRRRNLAEYRRDPVMAQIKRGKLGIDNFFILFGIFGSLMIPLYVYRKFRSHREAIVAGRLAPPEVIRRLDEDSPISLEDVTIHEIKYYNPERTREEDAKRKVWEERQRLERELYF